MCGGVGLPVVEDRVVDLGVVVVGVQVEQPVPPVAPLVLLLQQVLGYHVPHVTLVVEHRIPHPVKFSFNIVD